MSQKSNPEIAKILKELERIVEWFESDEVKIDQALNKYEEGLAKIAELESYINSAKVKVEKINKKFDVK